jgi:ketosteroid isomerase-like protein
VEANVDTLRRGYAALNRGDLSEVLDLVANDIAWESGTGDKGRGRESFRQFLQSWLDSFDEFRDELVEVLERDDHIVAVVDQTGRGRASGVEVAIRIAHVWTIGGDRAVRWRGCPNRAAALEAIETDEA